jgi:hypothetical protein
LSLFEIISFLSKLLFAIAFICGFIAYRKFTELLRMEYQRHRISWLEDGSPVSSFWQPKGRDFIRGRFWAEAVSIAWMFTTPSWVRNDPEALKCLSQYRTYSAVSCVLIVVVVVAVNSFGLWGRGN